VRKLPALANGDLDQRGITSGAARCARQGAYAALGTEQDEPEFSLAEYWRRGQVFERLRLAEWDAAYPGEVQRHRPIPWTCGANIRFYGEADGYHAPTRRIIEIVSAVTPSTNTLTTKIEQAKMYTVLDREAESAVLDVIDPSRLVPVDSIPIRITADDRREVKHKIRGVGRALKTKGEVLPDRICSRPADGRDHMCAFVSTCFAGWEEPPVNVADDPRAEYLGHRLLRLERERKAAKAGLAVADEAWRETLAEVSELAPPGKTVVGPALVNRIEVKGRVSFRYQVAVKAGAVDPDTVAEFVTEGEPTQRWDVRPLDPGEEYR
jgi:hypothetical protein